MNVRSAQPVPAPARPGGFTLVELLVVVVIISILAGVSLATLNLARQAARQKKTIALVTKLHRIIMRRYEEYKTCRPIDTGALGITDPNLAAQAKLDALRDLMRMELPERWPDVAKGPITFSWGNISQPPVSLLYLLKGAPTPDFRTAEMLYMIVNTGSAADREHFSESDVGDADGDGYPEFHDGWGRPIYFLRWAPGFTEWSDIQIDDAEHHDAFDTRKIYEKDYHLIPLIYSGGPDGEPGLEILDGYEYDPGKLYTSGIGAPDPANPSAHHDNIHNHNIEQR